MESMTAAWIDRDVVRCSGKDAATFLQGQITQDVVAMIDGESRWSLVLQPQGKVEALVRVSRLGPEELILDVAAGHAESMLARLNRFKLRVVCEFERLDGWRCLSVRGPGSDEVDTSSAAIATKPRWPGVEGIDLLGPEVVMPAGIELDPQGIELARIRAGVPEAGSELDESTIPAEAGVWLIESTVSFTKGCYVGQELVARVDSRGSNTPRRLRHIQLDAFEAPSALSPGAELTSEDGDIVGTITSISGNDALAYVRRAIEPGARVTVAATAATVEALPAG